MVKFRAIPETVASSDYENDSRDPCLHIAFKKLRFPLNFITAPIIADLLLLAVSAIGRKEVKDGTIGTAHIHPLDIMLFFITLAYIAISIDASGLIRWLAFKVLGWGGDVGHRLFFYLYAFFFSLGSFIGNDPIILSGTAFLAYMTRVSKNITDPRAWIYSQFAVANISSAILVSSNPTNLVLAGAFNIKFIVYTANMVVPAVVTGIGLFPFLLYIVFNEPGLIPPKIDRWTLPEPENPDSAPRQPVNPNIPNARGPDARLIVNDEGEEMESNLQLSLEELLNPFLDKGGAAFGAVVMAATLITVLALNAASTSTGQYPVFYVTLPAAFIVFAWDFFFDWSRRDETRKLAREGRERIERERSSRLSELAENTQHVSIPEDVTHDSTKNPELSIPAITRTEATPRASQAPTPAATPPSPPNDHTEAASAGKSLEKSITLGEGAMETQPTSTKPTTLVSLCKQCFKWLHETFPTVIAVFSHLPLALVPFAFAMFVLVQALVSKGWVRVFAYGWGHWVGKTGSIGAVGGMGFLSVILCNVCAPECHPSIDINFAVRRHQHWHDHLVVPCYSGVVSNQRGERLNYHCSHVLGHGLQHGCRRELRRIQHGV